MKTVFSRPKAMTEKQMHYCPGCTHGIVHRLVAEVIDELDVQERTIGITSVGCSVFAMEYWDVDCLQAAHGRAPAVATGAKRVHPDSVIYTYQGDGDLAAIGTAEIVHAAARSENITVIFINNTIYGMTGGQMAPTTLVGQRSTTTPFGRDASHIGYPVKVVEMLSALEGVTYAARTSVQNTAGVLKTKKAIKKAFQTQINKEGFSIVEVLSMCPTNWGTKLDNPSEATKFVNDSMMKIFPLGVYKDGAAAAKQ